MKIRELFETFDTEPDPYAGMTPAEAYAAHAAKTSSVYHAHNAIPFGPNKHKLKKQLRRRHLELLKARDLLIKRLNPLGKSPAELLRRHINVDDHGVYFVSFDREMNSDTPSTNRIIQSLAPFVEDEDYQIVEGEERYSDDDEANYVIVGISIYNNEMFHNEQVVNELLRMAQGK
jgi:hypothetical protein